MRLINFAMYRLRYHLLHFLPLKYYSRNYSRKKRVDSKQRVVLSFTTMPDRISKIAVMLKSVLDQSVRVDAIYIAVPYFSKRLGVEYVIPKFLQDIPRLNILRCEDLGPVTKSIPTMLKEKGDADTKIIVLDDDQVYPKRQVEHLNYWSDLHPDAAIGAGGIIIPAESMPSEVLADDILSKWGHCRVSSTEITEPRKVDFLFGFAGYLLKPRFFSDSYFDYTDAPEEAFFEDDVWTSGHLAQNRIDRVIFPKFNSRVRPASSRFTRDCINLCNKENSNYQYMDKVYNFFKDRGGFKKECNPVSNR